MRLVGAAVVGAGVAGARVVGAGVVGAGVVGAGVVGAGVVGAGMMGAGVVGAGVPACALPTAKANTANLSTATGAFLHLLLHTSRKGGGQCGSSAGLSDVFRAALAGARTWWPSSAQSVGPTYLAWLGSCNTTPVGGAQAWLDRGVLARWLRWAGLGWGGDRSCSAAPNCGRIVSCFTCRRKRRRFTVHMYCI